MTAVGFQPRRLAKTRDEAQGDRDLGQDREDDHKAGEEEADPGAVALLEEFRYGEDPVSDVEGKEEGDQRDEAEDSRPFVAPDRHAPGVAAPRQPDKMLGRDVGREEGGADEGPAQRAPGEKIVLRGLRAAGEEQAGASDGENVGRDRQPVDRLERHPLRPRR